MRNIPNSLLQQNPRKILLSTAQRVGDALFCTPGVALLKKYLPYTQFDVLAFGSAAGEVFHHNPAIQQVHISSPKKKMESLVQEYDLIISLMYEFTAYLENLSTPLISIGVPNHQKHRAQQVIEFVQSLFRKPMIPPPGYILYPQPEHFAAIQAILQTEGIDTSRDILVGCHLGCFRIARRFWQIWRRDRNQHRKVWPLENYVTLAKKLMAHHPRIRFIITGSENEKFLAKQFLKQLPEAISLIGKTSLFEAAALMYSLNLYITHDTGTLHLACLSEVPIVALFGATSPEYTGPYPLRPQHTIINQPDMHRITVDEVFTAVLKSLPL